MPSTNPSPLEALRRSVADAPPFPWAVGYSGGRDSGVLLWALSRLAPAGQVVALHVDHGWRPDEERRAEADLVADWCRQCGVALKSFPAPAKPNRTEADARNYRYSCFQAFVDAHPGSPVFLAHHADDQAETVLMRVLRGRSWQGLRGMPERRGPFRRPFLRLRARDLALTAERNQIPWHADSTNASDRWTRNYLRLRVFPLLSGRFPRAVEALTSLGEAWSWRGPSAELSRWEFDAGRAVLDAAVWDAWDPIERQVQLEAVSLALGAARPPSRKFLEAVVRSQRLEGAGWSWSRETQRVVWQRVAQNSVKEYFVVAEPELVYELPDYRFGWSRRGTADSLRVPADPDVPVIWRSALSGMRFASVDDADWGKEKRRKRLGAMNPGNRALVMQGGLIRAVVDVRNHSILWAEPCEKLNKPGIFVSLILLE